jgi:hypothetical protein
MAVPQDGQVKTKCRGKYADRMTWEMEGIT